MRTNVDKGNYQQFDELWNDLECINKYESKLFVSLGRADESNDSFSISEFIEIDNPKLAKQYLLVAFVFLSLFLIE